MSDTKNDTKNTAKPDSTEESPFPTKGSTTKASIQLQEGELEYRAIADWITLRKIHKPVAHMFHTAYIAEGQQADRPVTFIFNGGPGAASAYLHMGALGPQRVAFGESGTLPHPPTVVTDNTESWLAFTDLVFIDPVGTGFSRALKPEKKSPPAAPGEAPKEQNDAPKENPEFWDIQKDLDSIGEFIGRFLSMHGRWTSPIFIAGESYGGFRVAKMARHLQESCGVGLNGAILISPAIELDALGGSDYDLRYWIELFPALAGAAWHHGRARGVDAGATLAEVLAGAESFAANDLPRLLIQGAGLSDAERQKLVTRMADLCGLPADFVERAGGRVSSTRFCRELLRDQRRLCGHYDASLTSIDPFPDRNEYEGPDPSLFSIDRLFTGAINHQLRSTLKVDTELEYRLLSMEVNSSWKAGGPRHVFQPISGGMDDLRYGMSLNPHMQVFVAHGYFDLVTPYSSSQRLIDMMKLTPEQRQQLATENYKGGHMFYSWDESRLAFSSRMRSFYTGAIGNRS